MNYGIYNELQLREVFHLEFLRQFGRKVKAEFYAVKGGTNLRFFFNSIRYSEDMDIDLKGVRVNVVKDTIMNILKNADFRNNLKSYGIEDVIPPDMSKAKQTETIQRFTVHLITSSGEDLFTKVEFSLRGFKGDIVVEEVVGNVLRAYKMVPLVISHYDMHSAVMQKIGALAARSVIQARGSIQKFIRRLNRPVFTTHELAQAAGKSLSTTTQSLNYLEKQGIALKVYRGIWIDPNNPKVSPYAVIPFLLPRQRCYVSFISALHLHHMVEQIPQIITLASTSHTRTINTKIGTFCIHQLTPSFFKGFDWYKKTGSFLIAEPEKALVDSLYLSAYKKRQYGYFPELNFPPAFSFKKARYWANIIPNVRVRKNVQKKLKAISKG